jgi:hypothetical protein
MSPFNPDPQNRYPSPRSDSGQSRDDERVIEAEIIHDGCDDARGLTAAPVGAVTARNSSAAAAAPGTAASISRPSGPRAAAGRPVWRPASPWP